MKQLLTARFWRSLLAFVLAMMMPFNAVAGTLQLPAAVKVVQEQAFMNNTSVDRVVLPEGATTIESKAFAGATALERVVIPETVTFIADDAFEGVEGLVVETPKDSHAWQWAKRNFVKVEDPNAPAVSAAFDQYNHTLYLGTGRTGVDIAKVVLTTELSENGTIEWKVEQVSEGEAGVEMTLGHPQQTNAEMEATVLAQNISAAGESTWKITAETSDGSVWSETFNVKVAEMPASMPTQILIPDPIITNVGERFEFIPSEMIELNGSLPDDGNRVYKGISVSALAPYENLEFFEDGFNNAIAFTPSRVRNYSVRVHAIIANYVIVEETTIAIVDPNFAVYYNQRMAKVYLNTDCDEVWIADAFADVMLGEGESIEWTLTKLEGDSSTLLELRIIENGQCAEVWTKSLTATGTSRWQLDGVAPNGAAWSETFELTVEDLPDDLPTEILMPEVFTTDVGHLFQFMPSERLSHNGTIPEGVFWNYQLNVSGDLLENEKLAYPIDGRHVGFSFTPDSPAVYQFIVKLNVANYTITAPARLIIGDPDCLKVSYEERTSTLYLNDHEEDAWIGWVSYDGLKAYSTIETGKIVSYSLEKISGDDCVELFFDSFGVNEVHARNIVSVGEAVWRVYAVLSDGSTWSEDITIAVEEEAPAKVESVHYFPTLYLEGNRDEMDVFQIEVDMELAEGEAIDYRVEKVSGDDCFDYRIDYMTEDGLSAFVVIDNLRDVGSAVLRASATLPDGTEWESEEFTVSVTHMPEDYPTELIVDYPVRGNVGERFVFKPSERVGFNGTLPDDGNLKFCFTSIYEEILKHETYEELEDDHHAAFAFTPDENARYGFSLYYYLGNHCLEHHGIIIIGDGNSSIGFVEADVMDTIFAVESEQEEHFWVGNAMLQRFHTLPAEEISWDLQLVESSNEEPAVTLELTDTFEGTHGVNMDAVAMSGETGWVTYRVTASWDQSSWSDDFTINVVNQPEGLPDGITVSPDYYHAEIGEQLNLLYSSIQLAEGEIPEGFTPVFEYWIPDEMRDEQQVEWTDEGVTVECVQDGLYQFEAAVRIGSYTLSAPVTVVIGEPCMGYDQPMKVAYTGIEDNVYAISGWVERYVLSEGEQFHWNVQILEGEELAEVYINAEPDGENYEVPVIVRNVGEQTGTLVLRLSVTSDNGLNLWQDFTIEILELPENLPTGITVNCAEYQINEGETLEFLYSDISFVDGEIPEDVEPTFEYWEFDGLEDVKWIDDGLRVTFHERGYYRGHAAAKIGNHTLTTPVVVMVGENVGIMLDRPTTTHYINDEDFTWTGDLKLEGFFPFEDEHIEWNMERIDENETTPAEVYFDNEFDDGFGTGVYLRGFTGETGSMTYRFIASSDWGGEWSVEHTINVEEMPENFPIGINMPDDGVLYLQPGSTVVAEYDMIQFVGGEVPEDATVYMEFWTDTVEEYGEPFEWNENGFTSVLKQEGRYFFRAVAYVNGYELQKQITVIVGSPEETEPWMNAQQAVYSMRAYMGAELWIGSFDVQAYELAEGENYHWTLEKISDENVSPVTLFLNGYYENDRGVNLNAHNVTGETGSVTYRLTVTTDGGLCLTHDVTVEVTEGRDDLPTGISVPRENWTVYQNNVIVLYTSDVAFVDGVVLEDDEVRTDFWNLECLGKQSYGWDGDQEALAIHFTELGTYELLAVKSVGGVKFYHPITINVVERGENDPYVDWTQDIHTIYTGVEDPSTWIGWGVLKNYDVNSDNDINWRFDRIDGQGYPPVEMYMQVFDEVHADIRYTNAREPGTAIYRLLVETSDGFMDSREIWLNVEELPDNLPTELNMQTVYELEAGDTFEFNAAEITFANGEVPEGASERYHVVNMDALYAMEGFEWTENGFKVPMNQEGRYVFTFGKQIGNYTVSQDVVVLVGNAYPADASLTLDVPVNTLFNDSGIEKSMLGYVSLDGFECVENEELYWNIERIDENEANPVEVVLDDQWENNLGVNVYACNYTGETGEVTLRVTASTNTGFSISEEFAVAVIEKPDNLFTSINVQYDHPTVALGEIYAISEEDILYEGGELSPEVTPYVEICADSDLGKLEGFAWKDHGFQVVFTENGRYHFEINVCYGGYEYVKHVYLYAGTGYADSTCVDWRQEVHTIYKDVENPSTWIGWGVLQNFNAFDEGSTNWNLERIDENGGNPVELYREVFDGVHADVRYDNIQETDSVTYRLTLTTDVGYTDYYDFTVNVEERPENLPTELDVQTVYHLEPGETFTFDAAEVGFANGTVPEGASMRWHVSDMEGLTSQESFQWTSETAFEVSFSEEGRHTFTVGKQVGNYSVDVTIVILVGNGVPADAWVEYWGTERSFYAGMEYCGWALDAMVHNYHLLDGEEFHWELEHVSGPEMELERNYDAVDGNGVWYDIVYTGDETGRSVYRLTLDAGNGFRDEQYFVFYIIELPDDLPSDIVVLREEIYLDIGDTYTAHYDDLWLTDDGAVPEDAEIRHEFHVPDSLSGYHGYEWTDEGFKVTFTENGRYNYHAVIKVNGFEYRKEIRIIVGSGIADDVRMGFFYGFDGLHYINDNMQWIGDMWLENYNVFEGEGIHWNVWSTDEAEPKANVFVDPVWNDGLNAAIRMDSFTGETGVSHYTVSVETDGGYYEEYEIEFELIDKPENFPEEIFVHQEDVYLQVNETYSARMNGFYWFNEGSVIPEGANHGAEFWPEELEEYHTFEWVEGGFDVTFTEPGRHHFYVNAAINGVDFTKEIRLHVGNGIPEDAHLNFEHAFVQHFINDQTQWIGDVHLENYLRFDNEEIRWEIEYLDEGEPLANVFIDPVWNDGMDAGVRVNDFRGEGEMNLRLRAFMDNNFSLFRDFSIVLLPMPENLPSDIVVEQEEIQLRVGETYEARTDGFAWFTDDGEIRYDIAEFFHEFYVDDELSNYHGFEWVNDGFNVTFYEEGRHQFYIAVTVNGVEYCKEIRLLVGDGVHNDARVEFHQEIYTAYAVEEGDVWIGHTEMADYKVFDCEQVNWWVERIDENEANPLNAYVANVWDPQQGADIHVDNFTGETGEVSFRVWAESEYGFVGYTDFTIEVVEQPEGLPTTLHVPSDNMSFNVGDEFVIHDYDLTVSDDGVIPEGAVVRYEYWDPEGTFYNQEVIWNEENGGVTVRFRHEGRYEFTVSLLINTYRLTRTIRIVVGDGMDEESIHMSLDHRIDPVYIGLDGACRIGEIYIESFNVFEEETIEWTIEPQNAEDTDAATVFVSSNWERNLGANFAVDNAGLTAVGETTYVIKAVLPTGMELSEEITLHVEELPGGLPVDLFIEQEEHNLMIGDTFTMMCSEVQFGEGFIPENAAIHVELWPDERLENLPGFEFCYDEENGDNGINVHFEEPGEYVVTAAAWIGNWMLFKDVRINVTEPWKMALLVCSPDQVEEEYVAAMKVVETYGEDHVIVETFPHDFAENVDETIDKIVGFAEREAVKAIIVSQAVLGTTEAFRRINEMRPELLLISGIPSEPIAGLAAEADIVMYADEAAQAQPMMDNCEAWGVDTLVHYSFARHMNNEVIAERYHRLAAIGQEKGIEVLFVETPDPISGDDGFEQMTGFIADNVREVMAERREQKVAFFGTNCGMQATLQAAVLEYENAYYPQPCCPSPYHGFGEALGLDLSFDMNPKDALRAIGNALAEYGAADRFATGALAVNMGIIEAAAQYAAGYAEGGITSQNDGEVINQMFNAKFGNPADTSTDYENVYAADVEIVTFDAFAGVYQARIAVLTGSQAQGYEEYLAAQQYIEAYGEDRVVIDYYPEDFYTEEAQEIIASKIADFAGDPNVSAIIVMQAIPGTAEGFRRVRQMRDDVLLIAGAPQEDMTEMSELADVMLYSDEPAQAETIMDTCEKWEIDKFVHLSFERHMNLGAVSARFDRICERADELGIQVIPAEITDPAVDFNGALQSVQQIVEETMAGSEGEKIAFFSTNCGVQAALQSAVLAHENAYYPQPCCPSPYHGFPETLGLELDPSGNHKQALRDIANRLQGFNAVERFSTWGMPVNMGMMEVAGKYAITYANDELSRKHDSETVIHLIRNTLGNARISNEAFGNGYSILLDPVDFGDYEGVYQGKIAIVTGTETQGYEELVAAQRAMDTYGENRVVLETYPDNFMDQQQEVADRIAALADDPNVEAIIVMQSVPGTLEGFRRVRDVRDDMLLISGLPQESFEEMSCAADLMLFADEPAQAHPIMDKCEEWGIDAFVHLSFERHMNLDAVRARLDLIYERAEENGIEVIEADIIDPGVDFDGALQSVRDTVAGVMAEHEGQKIAFYTTNCGVQSALQLAVLEYENAYYPLPCCPSPYHGFAETLGLELDLDDSKAAMRAIGNELYELGAAHRFSTWASPVNMSIIDVAADYAVAYIDGQIAKGEEADTIRELYAYRFSDAVVHDTEFNNSFAVSFEAANFIDYVSANDLIQVWVPEAMVGFTADQFEAFKQENEQYADANIHIQAVNEGDTADRMYADPDYGADIFGFVQDQLNRMYNSALTLVPDEYAEIIRENNDAGSVAAATMYDNLCAYPMTSDNGYFLYYDKSVVSDPGSLEAILADCEAAGKTFHMDLTSGWYQPAFFFGTGCDLFYYTNDETGKFDNYRINIVSDNGLRALKSMISLVESPAFRNGSEPEENMGALVSGTWASLGVQEVLGDNYAAVKLPTVEDYQMSSFGGYKLLGVRYQEDESRQELCNAFAMYLTSESVQLARFELAGWGPSNLNAQKNEAVQNDEALNALLSQMEYAMPQGQYPPEYWEASELFGKQLISGAFSGLSDEELWQILIAYEEMLTSFISIIA